MFRLCWVGFWFAITVAGIVLLLLPNDHALYLGLILAWAPPVLAGMGVVGVRKIWDERRRITGSVAAVTAYLWVADRIAIGMRTWRIERPYRTGFDPFGLPVEEATFFLVTTTLCVVGLAMLLPPPRRDAR